MRVFFYASAKGRQYFEENYKEIISEIENQGSQVLSTPEQTAKPTDEILKEANAQLKLLHEAEISIFEASFP
jgi:single-stranded DNA-specific DHH superfamily exonuclease